MLAFSARGNKMKKLSMVLCLSLSLIGLQALAQSTEIVNGHPVKLTDNYAKHTVALGENELMCTGVLIAPHFVLTAGHCTADVRHGKVYFGTDKSNFITRNVVAATEHPEYCRESDCGTLTSVGDNDITVIQFEGDIPAGFSPVEVASKSLLTAGVSIHLAGFGANEFGDYEDILKAVEVPFDQFNGETEFKTNELKAGSCNGDSGGPAFVQKDGKLLVAGLTSRGDGPCRRVGIYTLVEHYASWIHEVMANPAH